MPSNSARSRILERLARPYYGSVLDTERGELSRAELEKLGQALLTVDRALAVTAAWSAARAMIFPQLEEASVSEAAAAIVEASVWIGTSSPIRDDYLPAWLALQKYDPAAQQEPLAARRASAVRCLSAALRCCIEPTVERFVDTIEQLAFAQRDAAYPASRAKDLWIAWLDDVVTRSDRFDERSVLTQLAATAQGTLRDLKPEGFFWEGVASEKGPLEVWTRDPKDGRLVVRVISFPSVKLVGSTLHVVVASFPDMVRDALRVEFMFEQEVHRSFMGSPYGGRSTRSSTSSKMGRGAGRLPLERALGNQSGWNMGDELANTDPSQIDYVEAKQPVGQDGTLKPMEVNKYGPSEEVSPDPDEDPSGGDL